jgi:hypothetical protein
LIPATVKTRKGYLWLDYAPGKGVVLKWHPGRGADCLIANHRLFQTGQLSDAYEDAAIGYYHDYSGYVVILVALWLICKANCKF